MVVIKGGDVISLVAELLNINAYESAKYINDSFYLGVDFKEKKSTLKIERYHSKIELVKQFKKWEQETFYTLCNYLHILWKLEKIQDFENDLFVEALENKDYIEYLIDEYFLYGTDKDRIWLWKNYKKLINKISNRLNYFGGKQNNG